MSDAAADATAPPVPEEEVPPPAGEGLAEEEEAKAAAPVRPRAILDVRTEAAYEAGHAAGSVCIPAEELMGRLYELPETSTPLLVVHDAGAEDVLAEVAAALAKARWCDVQTATLPLPDTATETGSSTARLYRPSPALVRLVGTVEEGLKEAGLELQAFDMGCGHGRDMAYLAGRGWWVGGVDNRAPLLEHAVDLCRRAGGKAEVLNLDLKKKAFPLDPELCAFVVVVRFLLRDILRRIRSSVKPGGYVLYSHFLEGCHEVGPCTPKTEAHYFKRGELEALFSEEEGFEVVYAEESALPDGRPIIDFLARRRKVD
eukprot:Rhum_TRINITY_DN8916_c0_g2::Rhum_TRINITY_DN8916_c0_g2_i1::g.30584::m.30584